MGRIGPRRNRRVVAGPAAGPMGPMADRTRNLQPPLINGANLLAEYFRILQGLEVCDFLCYNISSVLRMGLGDNITVY